MGIYIWADGIYSGLRAEDTKLCVLVIIGVNEQGQKHFLAIEDGVRESTQSWREVYDITRHQRYWAHKTANILSKFPKLSQPKAKRALHEI